MMNLMTRLWKEDEGGDLTEYALILALVALGLTAALQRLATAIFIAYLTFSLKLVFHALFSR